MVILELVMRFETVGSNDFFEERVLVILESLQRLILFIKAKYGRQNNSRKDIITKINGK